MEQFFVHHSICVNMYAFRILVKPGRFEKILDMRKPDFEERKQLVQMYLQQHSTENGKCAR